jgi:hypothetical protein
MSLWSAEKRILALDGGGTRGIVSIAFLERIEALLKAASGKGDAFRLADHFHLIGGTSTGAVIAAALATGRTVAELKAFYLDLAPRVFRRYWRIPYLQSVFSDWPVTQILASELGDITLDDPRIRTQVAIIMKRVDTGSPWIVSNLPNQPYWHDGPDGLRHGNRHYKLANLVRASTAAPFYFGPQRIAISADVAGDFIDGGITPYNSPVIPLLMLATMRRYGLCWPLEPERLSLISIGTGRYRYTTSPIWKPGWKFTLWRPASLFAVDTLNGLIEDCQATSLMLMQWLGKSESPWWPNRDIEDLEGDLLAGRPLLSFQRYDLMLEKAWITENLGTEWLRDKFGGDLNDSQIRRLRRFDNPSAMSDLYMLAKEVAERQIRGPGAS